MTAPIEPKFYEYSQPSVDPSLSTITQDFGKLLNRNDQPLLTPFDINNVAAGVALTFNTDAGVPDVWIISIRPAAGVRVSVFNGPQGSGVPYRLGGGGKLKLPAVSEYLTVYVEGGSNAAFGTVVAVRKYGSFDIDPGDLA
jgi:hypothetical protein